MCADSVQIGIYICNARSLKNKVTALHDLIYDVNVSHKIFCFTESWLHPNFADNLLDPKNLYNIIRCDRVTGRGGGVCMFAHKELDINPVDINCNVSGVEALGVDISVCRILLFYRAPDTDISSFSIFIFKTCSSTKKFCILLGDFNCPSIDWNNYTCQGNSSEAVFLNTLLDLGFSQFVKSPTRKGNVRKFISRHHYYSTVDSINE